MKRLAAFAMSVPLLLAQAGGEPPRSVTGVRHWSLADATRVSIEVSGDFNFRSARLHNPERIYFDILNSRPLIDARPGYSETLEDRLVNRIRVAANAPDVTRVVLDLAEGTEASTSRLVNPDRLMIELRPSKPAAAPMETAVRPTPMARPGTLVGGAAAANKPASTPPARAAAVEYRAPVQPAPASVAVAGAKAADQPAPTPAVTAPEPKPAVRPAFPQMDAGPLAGVATPAEQPAAESHNLSSPKPDGNADAAAVKLPAGGQPVRPQPVMPATLAAAGSPKSPVSAPPAGPIEVAKAAKRTSEGGNSLVRTLGLKLSRIVIDPGHGGHDQGTSGPHGLLEKDVVLDIAQRLGQLIEDRMGAEVVFTRSDDIFIPLQARTAIANDKKADLFLSIHANSSPVPSVAGIETFYLSLNGTKYATDVAARENASFEKSVFDLPDLVQQIAKNDKAQESKEFAARVQAALYAFSAKNVPGSKDRGVRSAPFVVLIGAHMPSILTEIGFLTNSKDESLLKKPAYRQQLAEALYKGVNRYADSLSHFQSAPAPTATAASKPSSRPDPAVQ